MAGVGRHLDIQDRVVRTPTDLPALADDRWLRRRLERSITARTSDGYIPDWTDLPEIRFGWAQLSGGIPPFGSARLASTV